MKPIQGGVITFTGEYLKQTLNLPEDAIILKIIPTQNISYCFDVMFLSKTGWKIAEGSMFPKMEEK